MKTNSPSSLSSSDWFFDPHSSHSQEGILYMVGFSVVDKSNWICFKEKG